MKLMAAFLFALVLSGGALVALGGDARASEVATHGRSGTAGVASQQACPLPSGTELLNGISDIGYTGPTLPVAEALTDADDVVQRVWIHDRFAGPGELTWRVWSPILPGPLQGFDELEFGEAYFVVSNAAATWTFAAGDLPAVPTSVELVAGGNNVIYFGDERDVATVGGLGVGGLAVARLTEQLQSAQAFGVLQGNPIERIWRLDFGDAAMPWRVWASILPDALQGFELVEFGRVYFVIASEALTWPFPPCVLAEPEPDPEPEEQALDLTGDWVVTVTVTQEAAPLCAGDLGNPYFSNVRIDQTGTSVVMSGLGGANDPWTGAVDVEALRFSFGGTRPEDGGLTTANFEMTVSEDGNSLVGTEFWSWTGPGGTCPNGLSDVTAVRA